MEVVRAEVVPGWKPYPAFAIFGGMRFQLGLFHQPVRALADEISSILVVMPTVIEVRAELEFGSATLLFFHKLFNCPAKAACVAGINCFEEQENGAEFEEYYRSYKCCNTTSDINLIGKLCGRCDYWQPHKETLCENDQQGVPKNADSAHVRSAPKPHYRA